MPEPTAAFCISCGKPVEGDWCPEPCHTDLRDSNNRVTCRRKHGVCNCPDCCEVRRSRATDPSLSDIPLHIRIAEDVRNARSAAYMASREAWERAYDEAMQWRDWQTCEILIGEREQADWYTPDMGCAACQGDPEALGLHVCGKEPFE